MKSKQKLQNFGRIFQKNFDILSSSFFFVIFIEISLQKQITLCCFSKSINNIKVNTMWHIFVIWVYLFNTCIIIMFFLNVLSFNSKNFHIFMKKIILQRFLLLLRFYCILCYFFSHAAKKQLKILFSVCNFVLFTEKIINHI